LPRKLVFIFPGQASQYVGMGRNLHQHSPAARAVMERVARMEGLGAIPELCFSGPEELLTRTDNVQPAITAVSLMALAAIGEAATDAGVSIIPAACAGHSLGEYSAHAAAGNLPEGRVMRLVTWRGRWMNEASESPNPAGAMVAVMGLTVDRLQTIVQRIGPERLAVANINSPGQVILSGERAAVEQASEAARESGAKRCVMLNVSGAWHSPLMNSAWEKMTRLLEQEIVPDEVTISETTPVIANVTAGRVRDVDELRQTLSGQITAPVRWEECVRRLIEVVGYPGLPSQIAQEKSEGLQPWPLLVEVGPGKVLRGLLRSIDRMLEVVNVEDMAGVEQMINLI